MKEIRLCDNSERKFTIDLCNKNNLGIEIQSFSNPYIDNKQAYFKKQQLTLDVVKELYTKG